MDVATAALADAGRDRLLGGVGVGARAVISRPQRQLLESVYARNPRPSAGELDRVASQLAAVPRRVVRVWFQNKRARDRRRRHQRSPSTSSAADRSSSAAATTPVSAAAALVD